MNKFKLSLFALIAATVVGCGGGGGGGTAANDNGTTSVSTATANVVSDSGVSPAQTYIPHTGIYKTLSVLDFDLNKDGVLDIVKFRSGTESGYTNLYVEAHINNGDGTSYINETSKYFGKIGNNYGGAHDAHLADLNDDGLLDILTYSNCLMMGGTSVVFHQ